LLGGRRLGILSGAADGAGWSREAGEGYLGDVNELSDFKLVESANKVALGDGGNEAADVVFPAEERHGAPESLFCGFMGVGTIEVLRFGVVDGAVPGIAAMFYGNKRGPIGAYG
jgi:hypothetical protein